VDTLKREEIATMLAKQYSVKLPADYDMQIVRARVRDRGPALDAFRGLGLKAFMITEQAAGASANCDAPFYLWCDIDGTNRFLYGDGFEAVCGSFGRPLVEYWIGMGFRAAQTAGVPRSATREDLLVADRDELANLREREHDWLETCATDNRGLYAAAVALDPSRWRAVRFALWASAPDDLDACTRTTTYEVLHLSSPGLERLLLES
jgi:hypothetical protein